jgi:hypothetical protein
MLISGCGNSQEKTGESVLFRSDRLNIKLVQMYTDMPWHYYGLSHEIWCQSPQTSELNYHGIDRGWNRFSSSSISEPGPSPSRETRQQALSKAATAAIQHLHVINDEIVAYADGEFFAVTFDGCTSFSSWSARNIPLDVVIPLENSPYCPSGKCPPEANFWGDRNVTYSDIQIDITSKNISFHAHSKGIIGGKVVVTSKDAGMHWKVVRKSINTK